MLPSIQGSFPMNPKPVKTERRILVVDDEPRTREAVSLYLQGLGYVVESTGDAVSTIPAACIASESLIASAIALILEREKSLPPVQR